MRSRFCPWNQGFENGVVYLSNATKQVLDVLHFALFYFIYQRPIRQARRAHRKQEHPTLRRDGAQEGRASTSSREFEKDQIDKTKPKSRVISNGLRTVSTCQ